MSRRTVLLLVLASLCVAVPLAVGKAPRDRDRDHDRLPDKWEKRYHLSTKHRSGRGDPDHDRLTNRREYKARTNPRRADTDRDGIDDGAEIRAGTNPRKPPAGGCAAPSRNVRDGKDPWGSCFPGPSNTGVPDGTALTPYTGPCTITAANTVIDSRTVNCDIDVRAHGVVVKNSLVDGSVWVDGPDANASVTVADTTIDAGPVNGPTTRSEAIGSARFTAVRVELVRGRSGGWCEYYCEVRDSWIHGQDYDESGHVHFSGIRLGSGTLANSQKLIHNTIACDVKPSPPDGGCSADVTGYGDFATIQNNLVERNLLEASQGSATCAYGGSSDSKPYPNGANNVWRENVFERGPGRGACGHYFTMSDLDAGRRGNQWLRNRWNTGEPMPMPSD